MKSVYLVKVELDDEYVKDWTEKYINYHIDLYNGDIEKARKGITTFPLEHSIASDIESFLWNCPAIKSVNIETKDESEMD